MSIKQIVNCDICGKQKSETNHWFMGSADTESFCLARAAEDKYSHSVWIDLCGMRCASQAVARWMDHGDFSKRRGSLENS